MTDMAGHHGAHGAHGGHGGMDHSQMDHSQMAAPQVDHSQTDHSQMDHSQMAAPQVDHSQMDHSQMDHSQMTQASAPAGQSPAELAKPNPQSGLYPVAANGGKVLMYTDLRALKAAADYSATPGREIEMRLTGNMERYFWSFNDQKYTHAEPIRLQYGEHIRLKLINTTMMNHPIHLHGMWMQLDVGKGAFNPKKHVINVMPGQTVYADVSVDAPGEWPFHCHLMYHMHAGMMRKVIVERGKTDS
jgi:L-ascorbate oxidase